MKLVDDKPIMKKKSDNKYWINNINFNLHTNSLILNDLISTLLFFISHYEAYVLVCTHLPRLPVGKGTGPIF